MFAWATTPTFILSSIILLVVGVRALMIVWRENGSKPRGSEPGKGDHVISCEYNSGAGGGGSHGEFRVPKDPQTYAKAFIPMGAKRKE